MSLPLNEFLTFLNERQRDPRLNEILFPITKKSDAASLVLRHEKGRTKGTLFLFVCETKAPVIHVCST